MKCPDCGYLLKGKICFACEKVVHVETKIPVTKKARDKKVQDILNKGIPELIEELDGVYSKYIRLKYADENGICKCVTCGKYEFWLYIQNGHYITRSKKATRWEDLNCHPQCQRCNIILKGNYTSYSQALIQKYGPGILKLLEMKKGNKFNPGRFELTMLIKEYESKINLILKSKKIPLKQL
jgi:hypothetical protein